MNKNQLISGKCIDYTYDGLGVVKYDTFCVFVKGMLVGEEGEILITLVKKNFAYGRLMKLLTVSTQRAEMVCSFGKQCGGCQLQHFSYRHQGQFKRNVVQNDIRNIAKLDIEVGDIITMEKPYDYRNKVILPVGKDKNNKTIMGFYRYNSHDIIDIDYCYLQSEKTNNLIKKIKEMFDRYNYMDIIRYVMIREMSRTNQMMVVLVSYQKKVDGINEFIKELVNYQPEIKSVILNHNDKDTNVVLSDQDYLLYGDRYIEDKLCDNRYLISSHSFYQVNTYQTEILYQKAIELAQLSENDRVLDLYCGVGTIGLSLSKFVKEVYGVEIVQQAIDDARKNCDINKITNARFICGDAQTVTKQLLEEGVHFDCIFVDPPRKGCSKQTIDTLLSLNSPKIVYISCGPSTLARDLALLKDNYDIKEIIPVDMFPNTYHVETVVLLSHKT
ncbi:MAG: 23S rRNA (uracil(1939)-C(5))-methyltransferase RlmD [Erysipelotrichaceae bacterium]